MSQQTYPQNSRRDSQFQPPSKQQMSCNQTQYLHVQPTFEHRNRTLVDAQNSQQEQGVYSQNKEQMRNNNTFDNSIQFPPVSRSHNYRKTKSKGKNKKKGNFNTQNDHKTNQGGKYLKLEDTRDHKSKYNMQGSFKSSKVNIMRTESPNLSHHRELQTQKNTIYTYNQDSYLNNDQALGKRNNSILQQRPMQMRTANTDPISPFIQKSKYSEMYELCNNNMSKNTTTRMRIQNSQFLDSRSDLSSQSDVISQDSSENTSFNNIEKFNDSQAKDSDDQNAELDKSLGDVNKKLIQLKSEEKNNIRVRKIANKGHSKKLFDLNKSPGESPHRSRNVDSKSELKKVRYSSENGSTDSTSMCSPHPNLKKIDITSPLELSPPISKTKEERLKNQGTASQQNQSHSILNPEARLRELLNQNDIEVFDLRYCLQRLNNQFGFSYQVSDFKVYQRIERQANSDNSPVYSNPEPSIHDQAQTTPDLSNLTPEQEMLFKQVQIDFNLIKNPDILPQVTAKTWSIFDANKGAPLFTKSPEIQCEIASLTKIMTCYLVCTIISEWGLDPAKLYCRVSKRAAWVGGTSAVLREGQRLSVLDLLHGLMLPSGNDAAVVLAEHFGRYYMLEKAKTNYSTIRVVCEMDPFSKIDGKIFEKKFCKKMNQLAKHLKMRHTQYSNPHGLSDKANRSTAIDQQKLSFIALKNPLFKKIVSTQAYRTEKVFQIDQATSETKLIPYQWYNLNRLLSNKGFKGVKTGYTPNAGSCLTTHYINEKKGINLLITVLCCKTNEHRFTETAKLCYWAENKIDIENKFNQTSNPPQSNVI